MEIEIHLFNSTLQFSYFMTEIWVTALINESLYTVPNSFQAALKLLLQNNL